MLLVTVPARLLLQATETTSTLILFPWLTAYPCRQLRWGAARPDGAGATCVTARCTHYRITRIYYIYDAVVLQLRILREASGLRLHALVFWLGQGWLCPSRPGWGTGGLQKVPGGKAGLCLPLLFLQASA